jgi:hypothetical protein
MMKDCVIVVNVNTVMLTYPLSMTMRQMSMFVLYVMVEGV